MVEVSRLGGGQEDDHLSQRPAKYRPHRPHRSHGADFQGLRAGGTIVGYRLPVDRYRPLSKVPSAYRPRKNAAFCGFCSSLLVMAVGAVGILVSFPDCLLSLSVYPSAGATAMHLASNYIHSYRCCPSG